MARLRIFGWFPIIRIRLRPRDFCIVLGVAHKSRAGVLRWGGTRGRWEWAVGIGKLSGLAINRRRPGGAQCIIPNCERVAFDDLPYLRYICDYHKRGGR